MRQRGSASVEFALVLPVVVTILLGVAQVGVTVGEVLALHHAAREGARVYAITADASAASASARRAGNLGPDVTVVTEQDEDDAVIEITAPARVFPGVPAPSIRLRARATMRFERAPT